MGQEILRHEVDLQWLRWPLFQAEKTWQKNLVIFRGPIPSGSSVLIGLLFSLFSSCKDRSHDQTSPPAVAVPGPEASRILPAVAPPKAPVTSPSVVSTAPSPTGGASAVVALTAPHRPSPRTWVVDEAIDLGLDSAARAIPEGALLLDRLGTLELSRLKGPLSRSAHPTTTPLSPFETPAERLSKGGAPPAVLHQKAYFVLNGQLVRRGISPTSTLETLVENEAVVGRVVAPPDPSTRDAVVYLVRLPDRVVARLWIDGQSRDLSPEGAAASSAVLLSHGSQLLALSIEGRSGMTPLHQRRIQLGPGEPTVGEDEVVWVGGPAERSTELVGLATTAGDFAILPIERGVTDFGLAQVGLTQSGKGTANWRIFPNGLDPAPLAAASLCGDPSVIYAAPIEAKPHATQTISIASVTAEGLGEPQVLAQGNHFRRISVAPIEGGGLVVYATDGHLWGMTIRCPSSSGNSADRNRAPTTASVH